MKFLSLVLILKLVSPPLVAQNFDSLYVNLYTDSLKKGTHNYINIEGITSEGRVLPLDTNHISFTSNYGTFYGNSLWIDNSCANDRVTITVTLKEKTPVSKTFVVFIKKNEDTDLLPTEEEVIKLIKDKSRKNN